jgi:cytochrome c oxidase assembly factor CtaG
MEKETRKLKNGISGLVMAVLLLIISTQRALAHDGQPPAPHDLWSAWNWDPIIILSLMLGGWIYADGLWELRRRTGGWDAALRWRALSFAAGLFVLFLALISPLDTLATVLFSAHMIQHMLLIVVAPPLLVLGVSPAPFLLAWPQPTQRKLGQWWRRTRWLKTVRQALTQPPIVWALSALVLWAWHVPRLYQGALENEALHMLEHLSFLITSLLFWWTLMHPGTHLRRGDPGILALFTMALQSGVLGALITFAPTPWYAIYASSTQPWGLPPLEDQQLAGAIMWIPMGTVYSLAALILFMIRLAWIERAANERSGQIIGEKLETISHRVDKTRSEA